MTWSDVILFMELLFFLSTRDLQQQRRVCPPDFQLAIGAPLVGYALLQSLLLLRLFSWIRAAGATPAWWSFTFGAAALPTAVVKLTVPGATGIVAPLAPWLTAAGTLVVVAVAVMSLALLVRGRLLSPALDQKR